MQITTENLENGITKVSLEGSLDIAGSEEIDQQLSDIASSSNGILLDMSEVNFLASIGIRSLVMATKSLHLRNGQMVILNPQEVVAKVLTTAAIDKIIPVFEDEDAALAALA